MSLSIPSIFDSPLINDRIITVPPFLCCPYVRVLLKPWTSCPSDPYITAEVLHCQGKRTCQGKAKAAMSGAVVVLVLSGFQQPRNFLTACQAVATLLKRSTGNRKTATIVITIE